MSSQWLCSCLYATACLVNIVESRSANFSIFHCRGFV
jgi:hypothetical protein